MTGYPANPKTIGEMIRKRRLDLNLRQVDVGNQLGCDEMTVVNWEKGHTMPRINHMTEVVRFLGFNPFQVWDTVAQRLINSRKALGATQRHFAFKIGVNPGTLARWERGERVPAGKHLDRIDALCASIST